MKLLQKLQRWGIFSNKPSTPQPQQSLASITLEQPKELLEKSLQLEDPDDANRTPAHYLYRRASSAQGVFGTWVFQGKELCVTIECPWLNNLPNISCIPAGRYYCEYTYSPAFKKKLYILHAVPGRSGIRIHAGNVAGDRALGYRSDFRGCIGLGLRLGHIGQQLGILDSVLAMNNFMQVVEGKPFYLTIVDHLHES